MKSILLAGLLAVAGSLAFGADAAYWKEQLLGTAYIWNGGAAGTWDATTENWIGLDGNPAVWEDGQAAAFLEEADITVSGTKQVADIHTAASVTFSGDDVHVLDDSGIYWQEDSALTFDNDVTMGTNVQFQVRGAIETTSITPGPETTVMQINGNYENAGRVYLDTANLVINGRYDCTTGPLPNFRMSNGGSVTIGPDAKATLTTLGTGDEENRFWDGPLDIYSPVLLNNSRCNLGFGPYNIFVNCPAVNIWDGGSLTVSNSVYNPYGLNRMQLNIYTGGVFRATAQGQLGRATDSISIIGGTLINDYDLVGKYENDHCSLYDLRMEGGRVEGASLSALFDIWNYNRNSNWTIAGTEPSVVATDTIRLGAPNATLNAESGISRFLNLDVNDVTGDEATDLLISSRFYVVQSQTITEDGYPLNGFRKQGAGTLELSGTGSESFGTFFVQEGLVRFTDEATFTGMKLSLDGGNMDFGASTNITFLGWSISTNTVLTVQDGSVDLGPLESWTDGAKLYVKGADMTNRSLRVGEDAHALTEAQLASCWYIREDGALRKMKLSADGYLAPPPSAVMILIR